MIKRTKGRLELEGPYKGCKYFNLYYSREYKKSWFKKTDKPKGQSTMINRLRTNHYNLNDSLAKKNYIEDARCKCGAEKQDVYHIAFICNRFDMQREKFYRILEKITWLIGYDL